jgi:hypothetical protein
MYQSETNVKSFQDDFREHHNSLPKKSVISIDHPDEPTRVVLFNSHARRRSEVVTLHVNMPNVKVGAGNTKGGSITVPLTSCFIVGLESAV